MGINEDINQRKKDERVEKIIDIFHRFNDSLGEYYTSIDDSSLWNVSLGLTKIYFENNK